MATVCNPNWKRPSARSPWTRLWTKTHSSRRVTSSLFWLKNSKTTEPRKVFLKILASIKSITKFIAAQMPIFTQAFMRGRVRACLWERSHRLLKMSARPIASSRKQVPTIWITEPQNRSRMDFQDAWTTPILPIISKEQYWDKVPTLLWSKRITSSREWRLPSKFMTSLSSRPITRSRRVCLEKSSFWLC